MAEVKGPVYSPAKRTSPVVKGPVYPTQKNEPQQGNWWDGIGPFVGDVMRNFNDAATFGLYSKGLEATGLDPGAQEKIDNSNPVAKVLGTTGGYALPGGGISMGLSKMIPELAEATIPAIAANSAATSGIESLADSSIRDGRPNYLAAGLDTVLGGAVGAATAGAFRYGSAGSRVRARGGKLTAADKTAAKNFQTEARRNGVVLDNVEALQHVAPARSGDVRNLQDVSAASTKGSQAMHSFDELRKPGIQQAGRDVVTSIGPVKSPFEIQQAAKEALNTADEGFGGAAGHYFDQTATKKVAPNMVPKKEPAFQKAAKTIEDNATVRDQINSEVGGDAATNTVPYLDEVMRTLDRNLKGAPSAREKIGIQRATDRTRAIVDKQVPNYSKGRAIEEQGNNVIEELGSGPLGQIAGSPKSGAQGEALFGATNEADANAAREAMQILGKDDARGILANHLDTATTENPLQFANKALPNRYGRGLADEAMAGHPNNIGPTLDAAGAVNPKAGSLHSDNSADPGNTLWSMVRNFKKADVIKLLQDPAWVDKLGKVGILQDVVTKFGLSGEHDARKRTLDIIVHGGS